MTPPVVPDSRACWPVAVSAAVYVFFAMVLLKSESVIYLGFVNMLALTREQASWPLTVALIVSQLGGTSAQNTPTPYTLTKHEQVVRLFIYENDAIHRKEHRGLKAKTFHRCHTACSGDSV